MPEERASFNPDDIPQREERLHRFSHELKNRLGSMWQAATLLHAAQDGPEREQLLAMAETNYFKGARALEQLMEDFMVPRGITRIQPVAVELRTVLAKCIANINFRVVKKQQELRFQPGEDITVMGDPQVLEQLFEALLSNASKFAAKGTVIELSAQKREEVAIIEVKDQGSGLTEDDLKEIFTRYAILSTRSTDGESQARGTLARAQQWAQLHGGAVTATSAGPGHGSQFSVSLPLA